MLTALGLDPSLVSETAVVICAANMGMEPKATLHDNAHKVATLALRISKAEARVAIGLDPAVHLVGLDAGSAPADRLDAFEKLVKTFGVAYKRSCMSNCPAAMACRARSADEPGRLGAPRLLARVGSLQAAGRLSHRESPVGPALAEVAARLIATPGLLTYARAGTGLAVPSPSTLRLARPWAFVGDRGQIPVFTALPTSPYADRDDPVCSVVDSAEADGAEFGRLYFGWTWRLPSHAIPVLAPYYRMPVAGVILDAAREMSLALPLTRRGISRYAAAALDLAARLGWGYLVLPGDAPGPADVDTAEAIAAVVAETLARRGRVRCERDGWRLVTAHDVGVAVSTRVQVTLLSAALAAAGADGVPISTFNGHQGLEYALLVMRYPASGLSDADGFSLEMGRLCVGVSRHRHAGVVVGPRWLAPVLADPPISPEAPWPGRPDRMLGGWRAHVALPDHLDNLGASVAA